MPIYRKSSGGGGGGGIATATVLRDDGTSTSLTTADDTDLARGVTLASAIDQAAPGDLVLMGIGRFVFAAPKMLVNVNLRGQGHDTRVEGPAGGPAFDVAGAVTSISDCSIKGIFCSAGVTKLKDVRLDTSGDLAIRPIEFDGGTADLDNVALIAHPGGIAASTSSPVTMAVKGTVANKDLGANITLAPPSGFSVDPLYS